MSRRRRLLLADRALRDIEEIEDYSKERWGDQTASRFLDDLQAALERLREHPELLRQEEGFQASGFYRVNKHLLVCDLSGRALIVLTVLHGAMDTAARLAELEPELTLEVQILHRKLHSKRRV